MIEIQFFFINVHKKSTKNGINYKFIGNMALVSIYQYWEDCFRSKIAKEFNIDKKDLVAPIMGDIRFIRISIIHHSGIALKQIEKCTILNWYKENDEIFIDKDKFEEIIFQIKQLIKEWQT